MMQPSPSLRSGIVAVIVTALAGCGSTSAQTEKPAAPEPIERQAFPSEPPPLVPEVVVATSFESTTTAIRPGKRFLLALHMKIHDGYRISWKNPGEIGKETTAEFTVPPGFEVVRVMYPTPDRFKVSGGFVGFGYKEETAIFAEVKAPPRLDPTEAYRFDVHAQWLACQRECAKEETQAFFEMVVDDSAPDPEVAPALEPHLAAVPAPLSDLRNSSHRLQRRAEGAVLKLSAPQVRWVDFYPETPADLKAVEVRGSDGQLHVDIRASAAPPEAVRGIAVADVDGKRSYYEVNVPWTN